MGSGRSLAAHAGLTAERDERPDEPAVELDDVDDEAV